MADQNITELPIKTNSGVANTDYMLGIDASEGYQILVRDVAKYIVENYNGSTLAGTAQTPKSAIDTLNSNSLTALGTTITDPNTALTVGTYIITNMSSASNVPTDVTWTSDYYARLFVSYRTTSSRVFQTLYVGCPSGATDRVRVYVRQQVSASAFSEWIKTATGTDISALDSKLMSLPITDITNLTTEALIDAAYQACHDNMTDKTHYINLLNHGFNHSILGGGRYFLEGYRNNASYGWQKITSYLKLNGAPKIYTRSLDNGTWSAWCKIAVQTEVDALNSNLAGIKFVKVSTQSNTPKVFSVGTSGRGMLFTMDTDTTRCGAYIYYSSSSTATANFVPIKEASSITIDKSTPGKISITSPGVTMLLFIVVYSTLTVD